MSALGLLTQFGLTQSAGGGPSPGGAHLIQAQPSPIASGFTHAAQVGWEFTVGNASLTASAARIFMNSANFAQVEETVRLWDASTQTLVASVAITPVAGDTWAQASFSSPVTLAANTSYRLTTRRTAGSSRGVRTIAASSLTLHSGVTHTTSLFANNDNYPGTDSATDVYGLVDLLVA